MDETISPLPEWYSWRGITDRVYTYWYLTERVDKFMDVVGLAISFFPMGATRAAQFFTRIPVYGHKGQIVGMTVRASDRLFRLEGRTHSPMMPHQSDYFGVKWARGAGMETEGHPLALYTIDRCGLPGLLSRRELYFKSQDVVLRSKRVGDLFEQFPNGRLIHDFTYGGEGISYIFAVP